MRLSTRGLVPRLQKLSARHQLLFACCCSERVVPVYRNLAEGEDWDAPAFLDGIMEKLWGHVEGRPIPAAEAEALGKKVLALTPEGSSESNFLGMAQCAAGAVWYCLELTMKADEKALKGVASVPLEVAKEWIYMVSDFDPTGEARDFQLCATVET